MRANSTLTWYGLTWANGNAASDHFKSGNLCRRYRSYGFSVSRQFAGTAMPTLTPSRLGLVALTAGLAVSAGCSREAFRSRADNDVVGVITQKNVYPAWEPKNWHVYADPRSRFAQSPFPDYPPFPGDDDAAYELSPNPQRPGRGGAGRIENDEYVKIICAWDAMNRAEDAAEAKLEAESEGGDPGTLSPLDTDRPGDYESNDPANPKAGEEFAAIAGGAASYLRTFQSDAPRYKLKVDQVVELGLFNSREFQDRREDLYLAALPVTLERYAFTAQAFATENLIREALGSEVSGGRANRWRLESEAGFSRQFVTGATLFFNLATDVVVNLGSGRPDLAFSTLTLSLAQPLLSGGGRAATLEPLTQSERTLLYAMRSYARFQKLFFVALVGDGNYTNNPFGLQGLSQNLGRGVGSNLTARPTGYLSTILLAATLENERKNVAALEQFLKLFQNLQEGGGVNILQVIRVEQNLLRSRTSVLRSTQLYLDNIDFFKLQLGVPATMPIELDAGPLKPIRRQLDRFEQVYEQLQDVVAEAGRFDPTETPAEYRDRWGRLFTQSPLARGTDFARAYPDWSAELRGLTADEIDDRLNRLAARRRQLLDEKAARELQGIGDTAEQVAAVEAVDAEADRLRFELALRAYESRPWQNAPPASREIAQSLVFRAAAEAGILVAIQARNSRLTVIRGDWPDLPPIVVDGCDLLELPLDSAYTKVAQTSLVNRLDLMNARAQVVDSWRRVTVAANSLQGVATVRYDLESFTPPDDNTPFAFAGSRTTNQLSMSIEPPFVRRAERNLYRSSLVSYQRQRRNLMAFEDNIITDARRDVRDLRRLAEAYAFQQRAVELAYAQVDNAQATFLAPPDPAAQSAAGEVAALTQQLLEAQSTLLTAQNNLYETWTTYLTSRLTLFADLELIPLDIRGVSLYEPSPDRPLADQPEPAPPAGERLPAPRPADAPAAERLPAPERVDE